MSDKTPVDQPGGRMTRDDLVRRLTHVAAELHDCPMCEPHAETVEAAAAALAAPPAAQTRASEDGITRYRLRCASCGQSFDPVRLYTGGGDQWLHDADEEGSAACGPVVVDRCSFDTPAAPPAAPPADLVALVREVLACAYQLDNKPHLLFASVRRLALALPDAFTDATVRMLDEAYSRAERLLPAAPRVPDTPQIQAGDVIEFAHGDDPPMFQRVTHPASVEDWNGKLRNRVRGIYRRIAPPQEPRR